MVSQRKFKEITFKKISESLLLDGHMLAHDKNKDLYALNTSLLINGLEPSKLLNFSEHGNLLSLIAVSDRKIWLLHASGQAQMLEKHLFEGVKKL